MSGSPPPPYSSALFNMYTIAFEGSSVACVLFGFYLALAGTNLSMLRQKGYNILWWYTVVQLVLTTLYLAISLYAAPAQSLAIFGIVGSYGPDALSPWPAVIVNVAFVLNTWSSDAFLLYRCYCLCMGNKYATAFPSLIYLATFGSSLAWLVVSSTPGAVYSTHSVQVAGICFWTCSVAMNVCASCFISAQLWKHRRSFTGLVGLSLGIRSMEITLESAMLYTVFVLIALIVFVLNSPLENVFFPVLGMVQVIAPSLIIYRMAYGIAFKADGDWRDKRPVYDTDVLCTTQVVNSGGTANQQDSNSFIHNVKNKV